MATAQLLLVVLSIIAAAWLFFLVRGFYLLIAGKMTNQQLARWIVTEIVLFAVMFVLILLTNVLMLPDAIRPW